VKRTVWVAAGFGLGVYASGRVRRTLVQLTPETLGERVRGLVTDAMVAGRHERAARERKLRETFASPRQPERHPRVPPGGPDRTGR
jgi:hypothetical protein